MKRQTRKWKAFTLIGPKDHDSIDKLRRDTKAAFTLIELIVVMAVISILVLLAAPKLLGYTERAQYTKLISTSKELERASERYFMDFEDWPRLTDDAYSAEEIHTFAEKIYDNTGKEVILDPAGNYYDIDYDKLSQYVKIPDDKMHYVLRNPVGKIYALEGLSESGIKRTQVIKAEDISVTLSEISMSALSSEKIQLTLSPADATYDSITFTSDNESVVEVDNFGNITAKQEGTASIFIATKDGRISKEVVIIVSSPFYWELNGSIFDIYSLMSHTYGATGIAVKASNGIDLTNKTIRVTAAASGASWSLPYTSSYDKLRPQNHVIGTVDLTLSELSSFSFRYTNSWIIIHKIEIID